MSETATSSAKENHARHGHKNGCNSRRYELVSAVLEWHGNMAFNTDPQSIDCWDNVYRPAAGPGQKVKKTKRKICV